MHRINTSYMHCVICIISIICFLSITIANEVLAESDASYLISDDIPREVQLELANLLKTSSKVFNMTPTSKPYQTLLSLYLSSYGKENTINEIEDLTEWIYNTLKHKNALIDIPDTVKTVEEIKQFLIQNADPGDILFFKANGILDRCLIYLGDGQTIIKQNNKYQIDDVPATFIESTTIRNQSSGIFAYAHIWGANYEHEAININIIIDSNATNFTGRVFKLYVRTEEGKYIICPDYIIVEREPGVYDIWDGSKFGIYRLEWEYDPVIIIEEQTDTKEGLPLRRKVNLEQQIYNISGEI